MIIVLNIVKEYLLDMEIKGRSNMTVTTHKYTMNAFFMWYGGDLDKIDTFTIKQYIKFCMETVKPSTINKRIATLKVFFNWCIEEEILTKNPAEKITYLPEKKPMIKTFNHEHVKAIINFYSGKFYLDVRNKTLVTMLIETGIRNSEIRQIQLKDISENSIKILGKGNKVRYVPISLHLQKQLFKFMRKREEYIAHKGFGTTYLFVSTHGDMLTIKMPLNVVKRACNELGIKDVNGIVHNCRRYYAQTMLDNTDLYTVSRLLGHSELRTTQIYLNSTDDKVILERGMNSPLSKFK